MNRVELSFRSFFWIFFNKKFAEKVGEFFIEKPEQPVEKPPVKPSVPLPSRCEAIQVLSVLQREGRLVDFLMETLDSYSDAQIGAAVRDIHRDCRAAVTRIFAPSAVVDKEEGSSVPVPSGFDPEQYRLIGNISGNPPYSGVLRHHGWQATKCELPLWQGSNNAVKVIAPAEVEVK